MANFSQAELYFQLEQNARDTQWLVYSSFNVTVIIYRRKDDNGITLHMQNIWNLRPGSLSDQFREPPAQISLETIFPDASLFPHAPTEGLFDILFAIFILSSQDSSADERFRLMLTAWDRIKPTGQSPSPRYDHPTYSADGYEWKHESNEESSESDDSTADPTYLTNDGVSISWGETGILDMPTWDGPLSQIKCTTLKISRSLSLGNVSIVYIAIWSSINGASLSEPIHVAIKVSDEDGILQTEYENYRKLRKAQGSLIPHCYGLGHSSTSSSWFLVTEYIHPPRLPIPSELKMWSKAERYGVFCSLTFCCD